MDADKEFEVLVKGFEVGAAAVRAEHDAQARDDLNAKPGPATSRATGPQPEPKKEPAPSGDQAADEPLFTRRRESPPQPSPAPAKEQGSGRRLPAWAAAVAAGLFLAVSVALGVTAVMLPRTPQPVILQMTGAVPPPVASVPAGVPVSQPQPLLPSGQALTIKQLPDLGGKHFAPPMDEAQHERLKQDLRETLRRNGYLPPGYTPPSPEPREEGGSPDKRVRFTSSKST